MHYLFEIINNFFSLPHDSIFGALPFIFPFAGTISAGSTALAADFVSTPSGTADSGKVAKLDARGRIPPVFGIPFSFSIYSWSIGVNHQFTDDSCFVGISGTTFKIIDPVNNQAQTRNLTSDWADADGLTSTVCLGLYLYVLAYDTATSPDTWRVYRYLKSNIGAGGTLMSFAGAVVLATTNSSLRMSCDGTNFYFNFQAGNSANDYAIAKYTISGTTLTYSSTITCGSTANRLNYFHVRSSDGHILGWGSGDQFTRRYNTSGTIQATGTVTYVRYEYMLSYGAAYFFVGEDTNSTYNLLPIE